MKSLSIVIFTGILMFVLGAGIDYWLGSETQRTPLIIENQ